MKPFALERYFAKYEFDTPYLFSSSDCQSLDLPTILSLATAEHRKLWDTLSLGYTESNGLTALRESIASLYKNITADDTLIIAPEEGIYITMQSQLSTGDEVIVTWPGYQSLYEIAQSKGCSINKWEVEHTDERGWYFDVNQLPTLITPKTRMLVINTPHNPTGAHFSQEEFQTIVAFAKEHNLLLFSDEMYRYLEFSEADRLPCASELYENAISLCGMSKSFNMPGLRMGWLTVQNKEIMKKLANYKDYTTICSSAPSEILALIGLQAHKQLAVQNIALIQKNIAVIHDFVAQHHKLLSWSPPRAGSVGLIKWHGNETVDELALRMIDETGVMILPSSTYHYDPSYFRVGLGRTNLPACVRELSKQPQKTLIK